MTTDTPNSSKTLQEAMARSLVLSMDEEPWTVKGVAGAIAAVTLIALLVSLIFFAQSRSRSACERAGYALSQQGKSFMCVDAKGALYEVPR